MTIYPNPWEFSNSDKNNLSFDKKYKIEFENLNEFAMGSPIAGRCYLITSTNKILLNTKSGGPILWNKQENKAIIPIWTTKFLKGNIQKIGILDVNKMTFTIYKEKYRVLDLRTFEDNIISGFDSPIYKTKSLNLDVTKLKIDQIIDLK